MLEFKNGIVGKLQIKVMGICKNTYDKLVR